MVLGVVAGLSGISSFGYVGGNVFGILRTANDGASWTYLDGGGLLVDKYISGVLASNNLIVCSVDRTLDGRGSEFGVYRSVDYGTSFVQLSTSSGQPSGLPYGSARLLIGDQSNPSVIYTALFAQGFGMNGVYRSEDFGKKWGKVSNATIDNLMSVCQGGVKISACLGSVVCVALTDCNSNSIWHVFWSNSGGSDWADLGLAQSSEPGNPNAQATFGSLLVDPANTNIIYVAGVSPMRCDLSQPPGSQWARLAGCVAPNPPNTGSIDCSGPHEDARGMALNQDGDLLYVCDGGIWIRTLPRVYAGEWSSMNNNLQVGEYHNIAYDSRFNVCVAGTQDCGTQRQAGSGQSFWSEIYCCDGAAVAVDSTTLPGDSIVYLSTQSFTQQFSQLVYNSSLGLVTNIHLPLVLTNGADPLQGQFLTPFRLNAVNPARLVIAGANTAYESLDQGNTISELGTNIHGGALDYGGWYESVSNPDVLYIASDQGVFVRTNAGATLELVAGLFSDGRPYDVAMVRSNWAIVFAITRSSVYMSTNAGAAWTNITGNLTGFFNCVRVGPSNMPPTVLVGANNGVWLSSAPNLGSWSQVGTNLPNALVWDLEYNPAADILLAGTMGRAAWMIANASTLVFAPAPPSIGSEPLSQTALPGATARFTVTVGGTAPFSYLWRKNAIPLSGATNATVYIPLAQQSDNGAYDVVVTNSLGSVTSIVAYLTVVGPTASNCAVSAPAGLLSWWTADGTANDRVGTNNGALHNGANFAAGKVGQAFSFDGIDDYVSAPYSTALAFGTNAFCIELWAAFSSTSGSPALLACDAGGGPLNKWIFWLNGGVLQLHVNGSALAYIGSTGFSPILGQWYHLALTRTANTFTFYVNGNFFSSVLNAVSIPAPNAPLTVGNAEGNFFFDGFIDDVRIYNRALASSEIQAIYAAGSNGMCPPAPLMFNDSPSYNKTSGFTFNARLRSGQSYHIQSNTNLATQNWITLTNFTAGTAAAFSYTDYNATNALMQFYRLVSP